MYGVFSLAYVILEWILAAQGVKAFKAGGGWWRLVDLDYVGMLSREEVERLMAVSDVGPGVPGVPEALWEAFRVETVRVVHLIVGAVMLWTGAVLGWVLLIGPAKLVDASKGLSKVYISTSLTSCNPPSWKLHRLTETAVGDVGCTTRADCVVRV